MRRDERRTAGGIGRGKPGVVGLDVSTGHLEFFFGVVHGNSSEHEDFMGEEDSQSGAEEDDELVAIALTPTSVQLKEAACIPQNI